MKKIAVVYHSGYGHTQVLAQNIAQGINESGVVAELYSVTDLSSELQELKDFDGIVFGSPTYMGAVSAPFKEFMDRSSKIWSEKGWKNKLATGFTNSYSLSGDKFNTLVQLVTFASQHGMIWVPLVEPNMSNPAGNPEAINRLGSFLGVMAQSDNESPEVTPPIGDRETSRLHGKHFAFMVKAFSL